MARWKQNIQNRTYWPSSDGYLDAAVFKCTVACVRCVTACQVDSCIDLKRGGAWREWQLQGSPSWSWKLLLRSVASCWLCTEVCQYDYGDHIHDTCQTSWTGMGSSVGIVQGQLSVLGRGMYISSACWQIMRPTQLLSNAHLELSCWCLKKESWRKRLVEMWWHTRRNQISSFGETDESI